MIKTRGIRVPDGDVLFTPGEVAKLLNISVPLVSQLPIKHLKFGKNSRRYPSTYVKKYIADCTVEPVGQCAK